jgi:hypothetical protein
VKFFGSWVVSSYLTVEKNAGMPEIYRFVMDYEYQEKKRREIY